MDCPDCDATVPVSKSLRKNDEPEECPECGAELEKSASPPTRLEK